MAFQDDARENLLIELFDLEQPPARGRADVDAYLSLDGLRLPFELKSTSRGGVTTVRDFGPEHIAKWQKEHWLIGVYDSKGKALKYALYGSPAMMKPWIDEKAEYIRPDFELAEHAPILLGEAHLDHICGRKTAYSLADAKRLHKKQFTMEQYRSASDIPGLKFSRQRMLEILQDRLRYVIQRGSTLNNPHIPASYFKDWERITENHADTLCRMVRNELGLRPRS